MQMYSHDVQYNRYDVIDKVYILHCSNTYNLYN